MTAFGTRMKQERERKGITLDDAAQATKISTRFLRAMEDERFEQLPGGIFNKGFIRAYARHLGIDADEAVADYLEITGIAPANTAERDEFPLKPPEGKAPPSTTQLPWGALAAVLLAVALGFSVWRFYSRQQSGHARNHSAKSLVAPDGSSNHMPTPLADTATPAATTNADATTPLGELNLTMYFREDCWVSITADGKDIVQDVVLIAGTKKSFTAEHQIVVKAGNVGGVDFQLNGKTLPQQGDPDEVKTLIFDANGVHAEPPPLEPSTVSPAQPQ